MPLDRSCGQDRPRADGLNLRSIKEAGCRYILDERHRTCGAPRRPGSSYCPGHHAICHIANGSTAQELELRRISKLAQTVGGRIGRETGPPPEAFVSRLERSRR